MTLTAVEAGARSVTTCLPARGLSGEPNEASRAHQLTHQPRCWSQKV